MVFSWFLLSLQREIKADNDFFLIAIRGKEDLYKRISKVKDSLAGKKIMVSSIGAKNVKVLFLMEFYEQKKCNWENGSFTAVYQKRQGGLFSRFLEFHEPLFFTQFSFLREFAQNLK